MSITINIAENQSAFQPGETISGTVGWNLPKDPKGFTINMLWTTEGKGSQDMEIVGSQTFSAFGNCGQQEFSFQLPMAPYSYSGTMISINWSLEVVVKRGSEFAQLPFCLSPTGEEIS